MGGLTGAAAAPLLFAAAAVLSAVLDRGGRAARLARALGAGPAWLPVLLAFALSGLAAGALGGTAHAALSPGPLAPALAAGAAALAAWRIASDRAQRPVPAEPTRALFAIFAALALLCAAAPARLAAFALAAAAGHGLAVGAGAAAGGVLGMAWTRYPRRP